MSKTIIIAAMPEELEILQNKFQTKHVEWNGWGYEVGEKYIFVLSGVGNINSAMCTEAAISFCKTQQFEIDEILNFGLCGAFDSHQIGYFVSIASVIHYDYDTTVLGKVEIRSNDLDDGEFVCASGDKFLNDRPKHCENATVCDMELAGIAQVCAFHGIKLRSIKIVSDIVGGNDQAEEYRASKRKLEETDIDDLIVAFKMDSSN